MMISKKENGLRLLVIIGMLGIFLTSSGLEGLLLAAQDREIVLIRG